MADEALSAVIHAALCVLFHGADRLLHGVLLAAHLAVGDDLALVVKAHDRADVEDGGDRCRRSGHAAAAAVEFQFGGIELVVDLIAVCCDPLRRLAQRLSRIAHVCRRVDEQAIARRAAQ